jgi:hydrogenase expression/formation protein HypE
MVCEAFEIDPVSSIAEGSLLITASPTHSEDILRRLKVDGINASIIGKVTRDIRARTLKRLDGSLVPLAIPKQDPFWPVFFEGLSKV